MQLLQCPADFDSFWADQLAALRYEDLGDTNVLDAFVAAEGLFRALPENAERRRAIVVVPLLFLAADDDPIRHEMQAAA